MAVPTTISENGFKAGSVVTAASLLLTPYEFPEVEN